MISSAKILEPKKHMSVDGKLEVVGLNTEHELSEDIKEICLIRGINMSSSSIDYSNLPLPIKLMSSFNVFDNLNGAPHELKNADVRELTVPPEYRNQNWFNLIKLYGHLNYREVCRILNHAACWVHCIEKAYPVIVLEHGSIITTEHSYHIPRASIVALGSNELSYHNNNVPHIPSPWAYSIDPVSARMLLEDLIRDGMVNPLPLMMTQNRYNIVCVKKAVRILEKSISDI